jgi:hypothetical protein
VETNSPEFCPTTWGNETGMAVGSILAIVFTILAGEFVLIQINVQFRQFKKKTRTLFFFLTVLGMAGFLSFRYMKKRSGYTRAREGVVAWDRNNAEMVQFNNIIG